MYPTQSIPPQSMNADQRLIEVAQLLANGIVRLRAAPDSDSSNSLAITASQSVHHVPKLLS